MAGFLRIHLYTAFTIALFFTFLGAARIDARVYIDIDSPSFTKFPIAVADFRKGDSTAAAADISSFLSTGIARYLEITGFFHIIPTQAFLADPARDNRIAFSDWTAIGAEYLVVGGWRYSNGVIKAQLRLYDVVRGELLLEKTFSRPVLDKERLARDMAASILQVMTGDGSILFTCIAFVLKKGSEGEIYTVDFAGNTITRITNLHSLTLAPRWSPDGRRLSFTSYRDGNPDLYVADLQTGEVRKISFHPGLNLSGSWSPDGRKILLTMSFDGNQEICVMEAATGRINRLTHDAAIDVSPTWSPDGRWIAFVSNRSGSPQIYVMDYAGAHIRRLTFEGSYNTSPSWSPKGNRIAYESSSSGRFQIFTIGIDGTDNVQVTPSDREHRYPSWSPDGRFLAFTTKEGGSSKIGVINANGTNRRIIGEGGYPAWSPVMP